jgi:2-succinyl-6-hydroxy-2,4-cyclohexadiene-1-carboxylate synthase
MRLWCLHGNLQLPTVWDSLAAQLTASLEMPLAIETEDLWKSLASSCEAWARQFCQRVSQSPPAERQVLLGYSLGGRLAFHAIIHQPALWTGAVIVSADPGLADEQVRQVRVRCDRTWGQRFLAEPWENLLAEWDALPIFAGRINTLPRPSSAFSRTLICQAFEAYSKGHQADLLPALSTLHHPPILYLSGAEDTPACQIGEKLAIACPNVTSAIIPDAAHRSPWENSSRFLQVVTPFLLSLVNP